MPRKKRQVAAPAEEPEDEMQVDDDENNTENPQDKNNQENNDDQEEDIGEEVRIPADPLEDFDLPENFFVPKVEENLGVGKLGEPRLMIHHITNENFKSYQGKVVLGPFHQNFSAVIGPNGSGKSNVIDSLLFVFTFKAAKIRLKKLSNLIHFSNSVKNNPPTSCSVTVHFQTVIDVVNKATGEQAEDRSYTVVPGSEFAISRTAFKDNTSVYKVDGKKKNVKQIKLRLKEEGIDLEHNRFLILQGEVEQIALMKPKALTEHDEGMLEYLEDIIGTNRYKEPVEKLKEHTDALSTMRQTKLERVTQMEGEVEELRGARNDAMHYLKQINEIKIKQHIKNQVNLKEAKKSLKIVQEKHEKINGIYERMQEDQKDDKAGLKQSEAEIKEISKKLDKKSRKLEKVTAVLKVMEKEQVDLNHESSTSKKLLEKQEKELKKNEKLVKKLETEPERLEAEIEGLEQEKVGLKEDEVQAEEEVRLKMDELTGKTDELKDQKSEKEQNLLAQAEEVTEFQKKLNLKNTELKLLTSEYDKIKSQYDTNKAELENLVSSSQGIDAEEEELDEMRNSLMTYNENLQEIANNIEKIRNSGEKGELSAKLNIEVAKLREKREAHANSGKGGSRLAKFFKQQESEGGLGEGQFYGRLGDLGGIDPEFDIAISTAASSLDSFVCDSNDTASKCIKLLKNHNMGQAHFIALNQMERHRNRCKTIDTPQNAVRLFDQIQVTHDRFKPAFWYSIQDTLVSDDIKQAQQLSRDNRGNRWRVVTLNGELIETSGALTGGGGRAKRGKMGQQVVREENRVTVQDVNEIEQKVDELESRVKEIDSELELLESDQRKGVNACRSLEAKIEKKSRDMKKVGDKLKLLEELVPKLEKDCKRLRPKPSETKTLNDDITSLEREYDVAKSRESAVNKEIKQIQDKIKKINDEIQGPAKLRLNEIREGIKENQKNLTKAKADIGKVGRNKKTGEDKIKSLNTEIEEIKVRLVEVEERLGVIETESKTEILKESELKGERKEIQDEFNELNKKLSNFRKNLSEAEGKLVDLKHEVKALKSQVSGQDKQVSGIQEDMDAIVLEEIDEEEIERDELENSMNTDDSEESEDSESEKMSNGEDDPSETGENDDNTNNSETVKNSQNTQTSKSKTQKSKNNQKQELKILSDVELSKQEISTLDREIYIITENSKKLQKNVDLAAIEEFKRRRKIYDKRVLELEKVTHLRNKKRTIVSKLECKRVEDFMAGFNTIKMKLKEMYQMITLGGDADLELVDNLNPFSEGVIFSVRPPSKSWKNISNLSGGEKTLSSLALVFALHYYKPTPFYVMDEIDAALDFRNVCIIANYIKDRTKNAQFVIISLRAEMFELADRLVGIYKVNDRSRTTTIDPNKVGVILDGSETEGEDQENQENMPPGQQLQQVP